MMPAEAEARKNTKFVAACARIYWATDQFNVKLTQN